MTNLNVAYIEDNEQDATLLLEQLKSVDMVDVHWWRDISDAHNISKCDIVLLDLMLIHSKGVESVRQCRQVAPKKPIIVLTHMEDAATQAECLHAGADYYFVKGEQDVKVILRAMEAALKAFAVRSAYEEEIKATKEYVAKAAELIRSINERIEKITG